MHELKNVRVRGRWSLRERYAGTSLSYHVAQLSGLSHCLSLLPLNSNVIITVDENYHQLPIP
jgi:hypothetical protein